MKSTRSRTAWTTTALTATLAAGVLYGTAASALSGAESGDGTYAFTAKINVGENSACSGALVDPQWVLTAASCFAVDGKPATAGKPTVTTTVTVGRTDLTQSGGNVVQAVDLVPHTDRDLVMVKLAWPVSATPVEIATTAPEAGEQLTSAGFGRTKTEWVPNKVHTAAFTVAGVDGGALSLNGSENAVICQGDAGGPALRTKGGKTELVAVNSLSWQGGCLGTDAAETRTGAVDVRVDDVAAWLGQVRQGTPAVRLQSLIPNVTSVMTSGDFNRDGRSDVAAITKDGNLYTFAGREDGTFEFGRPLWATDGSWTGMKKIIGGDFNGDGISDIVAVWGNGALRLYAGQADGSLAAGKAMWSDEKTNWNDMLQLTRFRPANSGRDGLLAVWNAGNKGDLYAYPANSDGTLASGRKMWPDSSWGNMNKVTAGDFNNDGLDDVVALAGDGSLLRYNGTTTGGLDKGASIWPDKGWGSMPVVLSGDFNGDGRTDLGGLWNNQQRFNLYKGDGKGAVGTGTNAWPSPTP
ncbi:FG-GAP-like repeat-containing protein, partial [Streptomyces sp. YS-3]|uniref:FG-GAP-like repeat-containing protein n=1 Tax=Streptomyces sp. YS-3 TaxID=3381352 RepID=UPI00386263E1